MSKLWRDRRPPTPPSEVVQNLIDNNRLFQASRKAAEYINSGVAVEVDVLIELIRNLTDSRRILSGVIDVERMLGQVRLIAREIANRGTNREIRSVRRTISGQSNDLAKGAVAELTPEA